MIVVLGDTRTLPLRSGRSLAVKAGLGGYICVKELDQGSLGGLGGRDTGVVAAMVLVPTECWLKRKEAGIKELLGINYQQT